jgi:hypothetical protein
MPGSTWRGCGGDHESESAEGQSKREHFETLDSVHRRGTLSRRVKNDLAFWVSMFRMVLCELLERPLVEIDGCINNQI